MSDENLEYGSVSDFISNDTEEVEIEYNGKLLKVEYQQKLSSQTMWEIIDNNMVNDDVKLKSFIPDYFDKIIEDTSVDRKAALLTQGDFDLQMKLFNEIGNPLEELEGLDADTKSKKK